MSTASTGAPTRAKASAVSRPMPLAAPVTSTGPADGSAVGLFTSAIARLGSWADLPGRLCRWADLPGRLCRQADLPGRLCRWADLPGRPSYGRDPLHVD